MGDISVAASITDEHGQAVAGISISVPTTRWTVERAETELVKHVQLLGTSLSSAKFPAYR
jgi:IclR family transcriptional regulator, pca regulon regulatory protein